MKQTKAERRKQRKKAKGKDNSDQEEDGDDDEDDDEVVPRLIKEKKPANVVEEDLDITFKDTLKLPPKDTGPKSWTLSGREAEALHMEEEDEDEDGDGGGQQQQRGDNKGQSEPLRQILQSGFIPVTKRKERGTEIINLCLLLAEGPFTQLTNL